MTRLIVLLTVLVAPLVATSSLGQDVAYWQAARHWQHTSPVTYYLHTIAFLLAAIIVKHHWRPPAPQTPSGETIGGTGRSEWNPRL